MKTPTPELEKQQKVRPSSQVVGEFLEEFLAEKQIVLAKAHQHTDSCYTEGYTLSEFQEQYQLVSHRSEALGILSWKANEVSAEVWKMGRHKAPKCGVCADELRLVSYRTEELLAEFFGIDLNKIEAERRALLEEFRNKPS